MLDLLAFPDHSRVWIYSSDQEIPDQSIPEIHQEIQAFAKNWLSHGSGLKATGGILHNYFIVLLVDEISNKPGGCSIDTSVKFIQSIGEKYNVNFFNRRIFHYIKNEMDRGEEILGWNCVVGRHFGSHIIHQTKKYIFLQKN